MQLDILKTSSEKISEIQSKYKGKSNMLSNSLFWLHFMSDEDLNELNLAVTFEMWDRELESVDIEIDAIPDKVANEILSNLIKDGKPRYKVDAYEKGEDL